MVDHQDAQDVHLLAAVGGNGNWIHKRIDGQHFTQAQRDSLFTKGPSDVLDHATSEIASGSKLGIDATKKLPGEGFKRPWPPLIKMDAAVKAKVEKLFNL